MLQLHSFPMRGRFAGRTACLAYRFPARVTAVLARRYHERLSVERLARELNVSYSSFRQAFKAQTGISPKQYQLQIRLHKAQDFLVNTPKSVGEIAEILGFDSAFHLSKQFKDSIGLAPQVW